jgi:hypothetical protein
MIKESGKLVARKGNKRKESLWIGQHGAKRKNIQMDLFGRMPKGI